MDIRRFILNTYQLAAICVIVFRTICIPMHNKLFAKSALKNVVRVRVIQHVYIDIGIIFLIKLILKIDL